MDYLDYIKKRIEEMKLGDNVYLFPSDKRHRPLFWKHHCEAYGTYIETALGEECNWCGIEREDALFDELKKDLENLDK